MILKHNQIKERPSKIYNFDDLQWKLKLFNNKILYIEDDILRTLNKEYSVIWANHWREQLNIMKNQDNFDQIKKESLKIVEKFFDKVNKIKKNSKDPNTKVASLILDKNNNILGEGINNFFEDNIFTWDRLGVDITETKYPYVVHAEQKAIFNLVKNNNFKNNKTKTIITTLLPCPQCAKLLILFNIDHVIYFNESDLFQNLAVKRLFEQNNIKFFHYPVEKKPKDYYYYIRFQEKHDAKLYKKHPKWDNIIGWGGSKTKKYT